MDRRKRERDRLRTKRADPAYRQRENERQQRRMRVRRSNRAYVEMERANGYWK